ncbi:MerR family transcriptional regulator [Maritalea sp.]|uniref:MerR family transcriptional regulator n=1 Tax=Maritalea sp. TaxID=2003361 RepID=UPI003EF4608D
MNIGEAGKKSGLSPDTIRFYEKRGLIFATKRDDKGHRYYADSDVSWLGLLACLRGTGMPLSHTETFTRLVQEGDQTIPDRIELLEEHRVHLQKKRDELDKYENHLNEKIAYYTEFLEKQNSQAAE